LRFRTADNTLLEHGRKGQFMNELLTRRSVLALTGAAFVAPGADMPKAAQQGDPTMQKSIDSNCAAYLDAWSQKDLDGIAVHLHPDVDFKGPMQELKGREAVLTSAKRIFPVLERFEVRARFVSGDRAIFVYDFVCREPIGVCRTAELVKFQDGLIRNIELFFDARPFEAMQRAQANRDTQK
jgi:SnoaL-like domain